MQYKLFAGISAILLLVSLAGCGENGVTPPPPPAAPALDWSKVANYDAANGDRILGTATAAFDGRNGRYMETILGNFCMDALAEYARHVSGKTIDFALFNDAFIRSFTNLSKGEIANSAISGNGTDTVVIATFTGEQVKDIIGGFVKSTTNGTWSRNCAPMVSKELNYTITGTTTATMAVTDIKVNGIVINDTNEYQVATGNFIGDNTTAGRFLPILPDEKKIKYAPTTVGHAIAMYILAKGTIDPADYPLGRYTGIVMVIP